MVKLVDKLYKYFFGMQHFETLALIITLCNWLFAFFCGWSNYGMHVDFSVCICYNMVIICLEIWHVFKFIQELALNYCICHIVWLSKSFASIIFCTCWAELEYCIGFSTCLFLHFFAIDISLRWWQGFVLFLWYHIIFWY